MLRKLKGFDVTKQKEADELLIDIDGTENKSLLGANAILGTSMAIAMPEQKNLKQLFQYLNDGNQTVLPSSNDEYLKWWKPCR